MASSRKIGAKSGFSQQDRDLDKFAPLNLQHQTTSQSQYNFEDSNEGNNQEEYDEFEDYVSGSDGDENPDEMFSGENSLFEPNQLKTSCLSSYKDLSSINWPHTCCFCGMKFNEKDKFENHVMWHSRKIKLRFKCRHEGCGKEYPIKESQKGNFPCQFCDGIYKNQRCLLRHQKAVHSTQNPPECKECGKFFKHNDYLRKHMQAIHLQLKPHNCTYCGKDFAYRSGFTRHLRNRHNIIL